MPYKNPEDRRVWDRKNRAANLEKVRARDRIKQRAQYASNPHRFARKSRAHYVKRAQQIGERTREHAIANCENVRTYKRKSRGIPEPTTLRPATCDCCGIAPVRRALHVDHCHVSGVFRGWLCHHCNTGLGLLGDSIKGLMNAVRYLERAVVDTIQ